MTGPADRPLTRIFCGPEVVRQVLDGGVECGLADAHHVVAGDDPLAAEVGQGGDGTSRGHDAGRVSSHDGQRVDADIHGRLEALAAGIDERALQIVDRRERDRMEHEVERAVGLLSQVEHAGHVVVFLDVARRDQLGADRIGQLADAPFHLVAGQVGETELRPFRQELLRDRPGDAEVVRHAQDHPFFPREQSHPRPLSPVLHQKTRLAHPRLDVSVVKYRDSPAHSTSTFRGDQSERRRTRQGNDARIDEQKSMARSRMSRWCDVSTDHVAAPRPGHGCSLRSE